MPEGFDPDVLEAIRQTWTQSHAENERARAYTQVALEEDATPSEPCEMRSKWSYTDTDSEEESDAHSEPPDVRSKWSYTDTDWDESSDTYSEAADSGPESPSSASSTAGSLDSYALDVYGSEVAIENASRMWLKRLKFRSATPAVSEIPVRSTGRFERPGLSERSQTFSTGAGSRPPLSRSAFTAPRLPRPQNGYRERSYTENFGLHPPVADGTPF
ncbi:hypothetical protein GGR52DRAFT_568552 [Hypoxylon sp. FL1284]|nr:hypothetical protein GGR52DRAFT_568552 [Hypoxylon sp. FL1284]